MELMKLKDTPIQEDKLLTVADKARLVKVIENEFDNCAVKFNKEMEDARYEFMEKYKKKVKFERLRSNLARAKAEVELCTEAIAEVGLDVEGGVRSAVYYGNERKHNTVCEQVKAQLDAYTASIKDASNLRNKAITQVTLSTTYSQAMDLMKGLLNGSE